MLLDLFFLLDGADEWALLEVGYATGSTEGATVTGTVDILNP